MDKPQQSPESDVGHCTQDRRESPLERKTYEIVDWRAENGRNMDRLAMLNEILEQNPSDAFARYGLAMEYSKSGQVEEAMAEFGKLLATHPDYTPGYFMAAQTLAAANRIDEAKNMLGDGIASAKRTGNTHALSEMEGMLGELG